MSKQKINKGNTHTNGVTFWVKPQHVRLLNEGVVDVKEGGVYLCFEKKVNDWLTEIHRDVAASYSGLFFFIFVHQSSHESVWKGFKKA